MRRRWCTPAAFAWQWHRSNTGRGCGMWSRRRCPICSTISCTWFSLLGCTVHVIYDISLRNNRISVWYLSVNSPRLIFRFNSSGAANGNPNPNHKPRDTDPNANPTNPNPKERKGKEDYLLYHIRKALRHGSHSFTCKLHHACFSLVSVHQMAPPWLR